MGVGYGKNVTVADPCSYTIKFIYDYAIQGDRIVDPRRQDSMRTDWTTASVTTIDATALASVVAAVQTQAEYATFIFGADGSVTTTARSPDSVTLVRATLAPGSLTGTPDRECATFKLCDLASALKGLKGTATLEWLSGRVRIGDGRVRTVIALEGRDEDKLRIPDLDLSASVMIPAESLSALTGRTDPKVTSAYRFDVTPAGLTIDAADETGIGSDLTIPASDCIMIEGSARAAYPWKPWATFLKVIPKGTDILIELDIDYPCRVTFAGEGWEGLWMVAPRIEAEDL